MKESQEWPDGNRVRKDPEYDSIFAQLKKGILAFAKNEMLSGGNEPMKWCNRYNCWCSDAEDITDSLGDCDYNCQGCEDCEEIGGAK